MRVKPSPLITVGLAIGYMAIVAITWIVVDIDYTTVGDSTANIVKGIVLPVALASVFMAVATSYLGWWKPAIHEEMRAPRWLWAVPLLMVLPGLGSLLGGLGPADRTAPYLLALGVGTLLVGFGEEMLTRGTGLVGLRGGFGEALSWFFSCLLFGLIHALNLFFGQSIGSTVQQIVIALVAGSVLYITRRVSGTLIVCMVLHAWIDFTTFAFSDASTKAESPFGILGFAQWGAFILAIVGVVIVLRRGSQQRETSQTRSRWREGPGSVHSGLGTAVRLRRGPSRVSRPRGTTRSRFRRKAPSTSTPTSSRTGLGSPGTASAPT